METTFTITYPNIGSLASCLASVNVQSGNYYPSFGPFSMTQISGSPNATVT